MGILSDLIPSEIEDLLTAAVPTATAPDVSFKPFTVTAPTGVIEGLGDGGTTFKMGEEQLAIQKALETAAMSRFGTALPIAGDLGVAGGELLGLGRQQLGVSPFGLAGQETAAQQAFGLGGQFMGQAGMPMGAREQDVYDRIRATQLGEEERQRLALEERLFTQGRGGVRTAMFGGAPEQLALAQAQQEAQDRAALMAITQAQQEQRQAADIGATYGQLGSNIATQRQALEAAQQAMAMGAMQGGMGLATGGLGLEQAQQQIGLGALQGAYIPQAAMLSAFSPALNVASLADVARRQQGELGLETQMANISGEVGRRTALANMYGSLYGGLLSAGGSLLGDLFGIFKK
jgi:hypothetical protein